jgi:hypothetical protein
MFEICGYPHYENVISNVLAFFLDPCREHKLGDLYIKSLLDAAGVDYSKMDLQYTVEREMRTVQGGFIDLILYNDSSCIVIENKIFSPLYNNLNDYYESGQRKSDNIHCLVLSLSEVKITNTYFKNITYKQLFEKIRLRLGEYIHNKTLNYFSLMFDFIDSIESLTKGGSSMSDDFYQFAKNNLDDLNALAKKLKDLQVELRKKVNAVNAIVNELTQDKPIKQWPYRELPKLEDAAVSDFTLENNIQIAIDSVINPNGWEFKIFFRKGPDTAVNLEDFCKGKKLKGAMEDDHFILEDKMDFNSDPSIVAKRIVDIINEVRSEPTLGNSQPCPSL